MAGEQIAELETTVINQMSVDFIFYHIEKCGGSSLRISLFDYFSKLYTRDEIFIPDRSCEMDFVRQHLQAICKQYDCSKLKVILSHMSANYPYKSLNIPAKMKFTCVRNPVDRVISHYYYFDYPVTQIHMIDMDQSVFDQYVAKMGKIQCDRMGCLDEYGFPTIANIKKQIQSFYFICIIEQLSDDIKQLNEMLNAEYKCEHVIGEYTVNVGDAEIKNHSELKTKISNIPTYDILLYNEVLAHRNAKK